MDTPTTIITFIYALVIGTVIGLVIGYVLALTTNKPKKTKEQLFEEKQAKLENYVFIDYGPTLCHNNPDSNNTNHKWIKTGALVGDGKPVAQCKYCDALGHYL